VRESDEIVEITGAKKTQGDEDVVETEGNGISSSIPSIDE
jgi:hypothetical protein